MLYMTLFIGGSGIYIKVTEQKLTTLPDDLEDILERAGIDEAVIPKLVLWGTSTEIILDRAFKSFENLTEVEISRSRHLHISQCAFSQSNLEIISVLECGLTSLPTTCILEKVKTLDLGLNKMTYVESHAFSSYVSLEELSLGKNEITHIESGAFTGTKIFRLFLFGNKLKCIPDLTSISSTLVHLYIQSNHIDVCSTEPQNHTFPLLRTLHLANNALSNLPLICYQSPNLHSMYINDNNFETVKDFRNVAAKLHLVDLSNNPIVCDCKVAWLKYLNQDMTKYGTVQCIKSGPNSYQDWKRLDRPTLEKFCHDTLLVSTSDYTHEKTILLSTISPTDSTATGKYRTWIASHF